MVLYRLPYSEEVVRITSNEILSYDNIDSLQCCRGFVMLPYNLQSSHPIIFFPADKVETLPIPTENVKEKKEEKSIAHIFNKESKPTDDYAIAFNKFIDALQKGQFTKLVLSRKKHIEGNFDEEKTLRMFWEACRKYPRMMIYLAQIPDEGTWLGCSPEILVSGEKSHYRTMALAGTMAIPESVPVKDVVWSQKNRREQEIVADYIRTKLTSRANVIEEEGPYTSRAGQLVHLKTEFHFTPQEGFSVLNMAKSLHPTPAVCGLPSAEANTFILKNEQYDRSYYSGVIGILDPNGTTNLYVNLRCAYLNKEHADLYAGGGILPDSTLLSEWQETEEKMKTISSLFTS